MKKQAVNPANLMSIPDYADHIKVTRQTVYNWLKEGKIKKVTFLGKHFIDKSTRV